MYIYIYIIYLFIFILFYFKNCDMWHFVRLPCVSMDLILCPLQLKSWQTVIVNVVVTNANSDIYNIVFWTSNHVVISSHR
jgi:hypothetical protein